jgi:cytoskeleton protein RodZ
MTDHHEIEDLFSAAEPQGQKAGARAESNRGKDTHVASIGARLRGAREAKGLSLADCGRDLRLPVRVLARLEVEEFGESEHFVFLRGALKSYVKFLGLPSGCCDDALRAAAPVEQPALVSVARTSRTRWLLQRYGTAATYIVLTATIAVPLVLLGLRGGLQRPAARIVSLDQSGASARTAPASAAQPRSTAPSPDASPFRASMTPFAAIGLSDENQPASTAAAPTPAPAPTPPVTVAASGQHTLTLVASADCWFEITDAGGDKVDSGMLHAGDSRTWHSAGPLHVTLGNADGVAVTRDGQPMALDAYRHANVARFDVFGSSAASEND